MAFPEYFSPAAMLVVAARRAAEAERHLRCGEGRGSSPAHASASRRPDGASFAGSRFPVPAPVASQPGGGTFGCMEGAAAQLSRSFFELQRDLPAERFAAAPPAANGSEREALLQPDSARSTQPPLSVQARPGGGAEATGQYLAAAESDDGAGGALSSARAGAWPSWRITPGEGAGLLSTGQDGAARGSQPPEPGRTRAGGCCRCHASPGPVLARSGARPGA